MAQSMKLFIDATILSDYRRDGFSRVTKEMVNEITSRLTGCIVACPASMKRAALPFKILDTPANIVNSNLVSNVKRFIWHQKQLPKAVLVNKADIYYSPIPEGMLCPVCPQMITIHDVSPLIFPESSPRMKYYYKFILPHIIANSSAILVDSVASKNDLYRYYKIPDIPVEVIQYGYNNALFHLVDRDSVISIKKKYGIDDYIFCLGEIRPYKNIHRLIDAFKAIKTKAVLVVAGKISNLEKGIKDSMGDIGSRVRILGFVPDEDLAPLMNGAKAFVHPSLYEGFGLPPLEAMACGCPVIVSNISSLPEVCGDAAVYFNPRDVRDIGNAIRYTLSDENVRDDLRRRSLMRASIFSYGKAADKIINIASQVMDSR